MQVNYTFTYAAPENWQWQVLDLNKAAFTTTTSVTGFNLTEDASRYFLNLEREGRDVVMLSTTPTDALQGLAYPNFFAVTDPFLELMNAILRD